MKKQLTYAVAALILFLAGYLSYAYASSADQQGFSADDQAAFVDSEVAALKAGLRLTSAQEENWHALETALRDAAKARASRTKEWREKAEGDSESHDTLEHFRLCAKFLNARSAELEKIADAAKSLFDSLDDGQKRRFGARFK